MAEKIIRTLDKDGVQVSYEVLFSHRRTISIVIKRATKQVIVKLPASENIQAADNFIAQKFKWVLKHLNNIEDREETINRRSYEAGSTHLYLGNEYTLEVVEGKPLSAHIVGDKIIVTTNKEEYIEAVLKIFYTNKAKQAIMPIFSEMSTAFYNRHKISPISVEFKYVKGYWGVCTSKRVVRLNIELIRAPEACIRYIIAHELCHLVHQNHSKRFYDLLLQEYPTWKESKTYLDKTISTRC